MITACAQRSFEQRDWAQHREDSQTRLQAYGDAVDRAEEAVRAVLGDQVHDQFVWVSIKAVYSGLIEGRPDWDIAETFYNSVTRRVFTTVGVNPYIEFVDTDFDQPPRDSDELPTRTVDGDAASLVERILAATPFEAPWADLADDIARVADVLRARHGIGRLVASLLRPVFYRGKAAYLIGRIRAGTDTAPLALALRNGPEGVFVDAVLTERAEISVLFGFTHSYFHVDTHVPWAIVRFLRGLLPRKRIGELYISLGIPKQGKTELYRDLIHHMQDTGEQFVHAAGTPGLVMVVFTPPGYDIVLKVVRDAFPLQKQTSLALVQDRYRWVYEHDRAGRLVDSQSFEYLEFPRDWFAPALLDDLLTSCGKAVALRGDRVSLRLAYLQREIEPLNLFVLRAEADAARAAVVDYGRALRDLAACDIFPGDLLLKNFGVTRNGRVAFYDYDEVLDLQHVRFRDIPEAHTPEDEMSATPWFSVAENDVFPEEFARFLGLSPDLRRVFLDHHAELFEASWWRATQQRLADGKILEFPPYPPSKRLR